MQARQMWGKAVVAAVLVLAAAESRGAGVERKTFGTMTTGETVELFTLRNGKGVTATIIGWGGIVVSFTAPDRNGQLADIVLGYDTLDPYLKPNPYFGALVGRYGNRIAKGEFSLDGQVYHLPKNNGENTLHGGNKGFGQKLWSIREVAGKNGQALELGYTSADGEEGFPGTLQVRVTYTLTEANELRIDYEVTTDKPTVVNLTNHSYFNLAGPAGGDILGHVLRVDADRFTPVGKGLIPTGELRSVAGTPFDFRTPTAIGARIDAKDSQLELGGGYDHNFVLNGTAGTLRLVARVSEPRSGRVLEVLTTEPGVQLYTGNFLDGATLGKGGQAYKRRTAFCLETQHFPDSPNQPSFPSTVLRPGATFRSTTVYRVSTEP
ncbi:MAG TPA: aldose epimerase family protein [Vicinamibacteria bacterium]|nr:aldose epimerase family protein [Vicinamibacteria bacterium]